MRTDNACEMYFVDDQHVMINITDEKILNFDKEGYIVEKNCPPNQTSPKIILESPIFNKIKYFVMQDIDDNKISLVKAIEDDPNMKIVEKPFLLDGLDSDLKKLNNNDLISLLNLDKLGKSVADSV